MHPSLLSRRTATAAALLPALLLVLLSAPIDSHSALLTRTTTRQQASFAFESSASTITSSSAPPRRRRPRGVAAGADVPTVATTTPRFFHRGDGLAYPSPDCRKNAAAVLVQRGMSTAPVPPDNADDDEDEDANIERIKQLISRSSRDREGGAPAQFERMAEDDVTPQVLAEMIETTFVRSCLDLSRGYVDVLKLFIVSVQAAYGSGVALSDLLRMVDVACGERRSANRPLMDEEVELRSTWVSVVYLTLETLGYAPPSPPSGAREERSTHDDDGEDMSDAVMPAEEDERSTFVRPVVDASEHVRSTYGDVIRFVVNEVKKGGGQSSSSSSTTMGVERVMEESGCRTPRRAEDDDDDPVARAVLSQSVRVALLTLAVVEEERKCEEDRARGPPAPRPQIPGI